MVELDDQDHDPGITEPDSGPAPDGDGPSPPSYCMPSCIWDALRDCIPPRAAVCKSTGGGSTSPASVLCDDPAGWQQRTFRGGQSGTTVTIVHDGVECVSMNTGGANPNPGIFYGKRSKVVGYISADGTKGASGSPSASTMNELEPARPECEEWTGEASKIRFPKLECDVTEQWGRTPQ